METESGNDQQKIPGEGYNDNMHIIFYGIMLSGNIVRPFHTVSPKQLKLSNKVVTIHANTLIEQSRILKQPQLAGDIICSYIAL